MRSNSLRASPGTQKSKTVPAPVAEPDPALIWFFDSSKQLLVFRDTGSGNAAAWSEDVLMKSGWNMLGIRSLPRVSVQG